MNPSLPVFPRRTVHLDFHTGPYIPDVGRDFDPAAFAQTFADAHVDSVTVFAKCHHGHLYYNTTHPARHPSLPAGLDLLGEQVEALHRVGIRAPIYLSVQCDEWAANNHPDWICLTPELRQVKHSSGAFAPGWQILDMSSPYQDFLADQLDEVLRRFAPVDGIFLDMCWDQVSCSRWAMDGMRREGLDPQEEADRKTYARRVAHGYMARYGAMVREAQKKQAPAYVWFNSRPKTHLYDEKQYLEHVEIEALPTGGWGYAYFPYVARFVRPLGLPTLSHTGRFHKSWGDNGAIKPAAALQYECCQILSQGLTNGVGDLLHPRGVPQEAVYNLIGSVYRHIRACEPFVEGMHHLSEVALIVDDTLGDNPGPSGLGAVRALQQLRQQFDIVPTGADIAGYRVVILPETTVADETLKARLRAFIAAGGGLIASGASALDPATGDPLLAEMGIATHGPSPFSHVFLRPDPAVGDDANLAPFDTVMYERGFRMTAAAPGAEVLCAVVEPYFERTYAQFSGHSYTPPDTLSPYAAAIQNGQVVTFAVPILEAFGKNANVPYRQLLGAALNRLLPRPLLTDRGPAHLEATAVGKGDTMAVHLISFLPSRQADGLDIVHDPFPLVAMPLSLRRETAPARVTLQPDGVAVPFTWHSGYVHVTLSVLDGHAILVVE